MLASGGQILAIDHVIVDNTLSGDGSTTALSVNTDYIASKEFVFNTSAELQEKINSVSSIATSAIEHAPIVSAENSTIGVTSALENGTVVYKLKANSNTSIIGIDGISAKQDETNAWILSYTGQQGNIYNGYPGSVDIFQSAGQWYISAYAPDVSDFVTSANTEFNQNYAYFLKNVNDNIVWSGVDLSNIGKMYEISSLTPERLQATISAIDENTSAYVLSAAPAEEFNTPTIAGTGLEATYDLENNQYDIKLDISGNNGISAKFDNIANMWNIGISANDYSYLAGLYDKQAVLTEGDIVKYDSNNAQRIKIDEDGYFILPDTGNKFTFCINESIENNTTTSHDYKLNKLALIKVNIQTNESETIVSTHSYYPSEVGSSDANMSFTLSHTPFYKYAIKYLGSDIPATANFVSKISIIEEITSLATAEGNSKAYGGIEPIWTDNDSTLIGLAYDRSQFKIVKGIDSDHPTLSALQINIQTSGGNIDNEAFEKVANLINSRMTETIPFGSLNNEASLPGGCQYAYLFRPPMEYEMTSDTRAYMFGGNGDGNVAVAVYEGLATNSKLIWQSNYAALPSVGGEVIMSYLENAPTGTISPNNLYYVCIRILKSDGGTGAWNSILGTKLHERTTSVGPLVPWCGKNNINSLSFPLTYTFQSDSLSNFGEHKPYVGFRTKD